MGDPILARRLASHVRELHTCPPVRSSRTYPCTKLAYIRSLSLLSTLYFLLSIY